MMNPSSLDPLAADFDELSGVGAVGGEELGDHLDVAAAVEGELGPRAPECLEKTTGSNSSE